MFCDTAHDEESGAMSTHVFYHSADLDGHCSGAICKYAMPDAILHPINYGDPFPWGEIKRNDTVYMVDFSLQPFSDMVKLNSYLDGQETGLVWIDHHKSAILEWEEHSRAVKTAELDTNFAACELTWNYFFSPDDMPLAVFRLGRYDIWKHHEHEGCLEFQYGMRMYETDPRSFTAMEMWTELFSVQLTLDKITNEGALLLRYEREQNKKFASAYAFETELDGLKCIAVNKGFTNSLVFESVYDEAKHDAMLSFAYRGGKWTVSLYATKPEIDVSVICKARGGGGHKGAAGFQCDTLPFLKVE
jgi:oligoribonuclease NrnB/cAMP/cGMP phosphodiesterase (DHH superfamily)